ncbi:hypothetical protein K438DRAFT_1763227 [Mycena galopus ATCC 62051]|nr:hypothetical protein K438DRAFT_1763227 [Mycena galopus ATCC 62051]
MCEKGHNRARLNFLASSVSTADDPVCCVSSTASAPFKTSTLLPFFKQIKVFNLGKALAAAATGELKEIIIFKNNATPVKVGEQIQRALLARPSKRKKTRRQDSTSIATMLCRAIANEPEERREQEKRTERAAATRILSVISGHSIAFAIGGGVNGYIGIGNRRREP